jgi:hypothetical protein
MRSRTEQQQQQLSALLTAEENAAVLNMIGPRSQSLATTVAQVTLNPNLSGFYVLLIRIRKDPKLFAGSGSVTRGLGAENGRKH